MRGLSLNLQLPTSCFVRNDATLEVLSHNGKTWRQSANRRVYVCQQRLRSKQFDPLCIKNEFLQCKRNISICRAYGSPPEVREDHPVQDGESDAEEPNEEKKPEEAVSKTTAGSITSWGTLPPRFKLILTTALAFVICNMDKVSRPFLGLQSPQIRFICRECIQLETLKIFAFFICSNKRYPLKTWTVDRLNSVDNGGNRA